MAQMTDTIKRYTVFNLEEYAGEHNRYDKALLYPIQHTLTVVSADGTRRSISVGQLETFLIYAAKYKHMNAALIAVARGGVDICKPEQSENDINNHC